MIHLSSVIPGQRSRDPESSGWFKLLLESGLHRNDEWIIESSAILRCLRRPHPDWTPDPQSWNRSRRHEN